MGTWGPEAWDSDTAADWFGDLFDATGLRDRAVEALSADPIDEPEIVRAGAYLVRVLGHVYVWPVDHLDADLKAAIAGLKAILHPDGTIAEYDECVEQIKTEIAELESRLKTE